MREGYRNVEHVKRYTALGFGTDQGKLGNINGMAVLADILGKKIPEVGTTTFRPAYTPVRFRRRRAGESVGELYDPVRKTAIHEWHETTGAPMEVVGQWHRPWYFPRDGEDLHAAVARECLAVRNSVGVMDASTAGQDRTPAGPDVVEFLERIYTHNVGRMKVGRCAYGIMLGEGRHAHGRRCDGAPRRASLLPHHDHRRRRQRVELAGKLAADRVAGA